MKCPVCSDTSLLMTERSGIEIDYCPQCRGVWLDRGELDKLIERAAPAAPAASAAPAPGMQVSYPPTAANRPARSDFDFDDDDDDDDRHRRHDGKGMFGGKRRKKGLLGELFDF